MQVVCLDDLIDKDHLARAIWEYLEQVNLPVCLENKNHKRKTQISNYMNYSYHCNMTRTKKICSKIIKNFDLIIFYCVI